MLYADDLPTELLVSPRHRAHARERAALHADRPHPFDVKNPLILRHCFAPDCGKPAMWREEGSGEWFCGGHTS